MSTINSKRNRGGRINSGSRTDKRQIYTQDRPPRNRGPVIEKSIDGVYKNARLTHVIFSMVGTVVRVQVKNGIIYEGILKTVSAGGDTVIDYAHMVEENGNEGQSQSSTPSKERIITKLVVKFSDLVSINAANLDLDYAVKDSFTDTGISKYNGEIKDKEMKELQPWESEGGDEITLDGTGDKSSNGWDPNDMFHTNAVQFNVQSSYDDSLEQYTTRLERGNSEEYRRREQQASKIAAEIERCESYKKHIALENGEGDDEEAAFSSVVRPGESSSQSQPTGTGGPGKYIPPNKRAMGSGGKSSRGGYVAQSNRNIPSQSPQTTQVSSQPTVDNVNGEETGRPTIPVSTAGPTVKTSPVGHDHGPPPVTDKPDHVPHATHANKVEGKKSLKGYNNVGRNLPHTWRDEQIKELKEFSSKFKLDDNKDTSKEKDKEKEHNTKDNKEKASLERKESVSEEKDTGSEKVITESKESSQSTVPVTSAPQQVAPSAEEKKTEASSSAQAESSSEPAPETGYKILEVSTLNPKADEWVPRQQQQQQQQQSFQPKQASQQQIPTPPRPQTQSPMNIPLSIPAQPVYPSPGQHYIMPPQHQQMVLNNPAAAAAAGQPQYNVRPKRAVVSVKPDYTASAVQAATGQPLLAQSAQPGYIQYIPHQMMPPQPTGYQMGQVMPMPAANPSSQRFMTPTSVQGHQPSSIQHGTGIEQSNPALQASQVYMTQQNQQGPMPAHMSHASHFNHPNHIIMSNPNTQQPQQNSQMNPPPPTGATGHHHPAPSPVHTNPNQQSMNPGPHPPSSGTPQPPQGYPQNALQAHPPLQPSPHNPTSPQTMQQMHFQQYTSHGHPMQMQGSAGGQQFSVPQQSSVPTSVTYSMQAHTHQSPHMQPQIVMMPPPGGMNHPHIHNSQFQGHPMPGSMQQQLMSQSGVQSLTGQTPGQGPHHQMQHFIPQGLTAAALTSALHVRPEHFIVQHLRK
ncbi:ataxin-2-like protein isoform X2 [Mercenaria mercenaria]|uniref:ataxin-2-like protein isoform X2 n=1 Tax=Mercenaria mercenaria TaxID=6596 RepID=UPI00234F6DBF|nr:ataxin-2-like protein isoform X2 [Mercenaria mercenaria]